MNQFEYTKLIFSSSLDKPLRTLLMADGISSVTETGSNSKRKMIEAQLKCVR